MRILHIALTDAFNEEMSYQENLITKYHVKYGHDVVLLTNCFEIKKDGIIRYVQPVDKLLSSGVRLIRLKYHKVINKYFTNKIRKIDGAYKLFEQIRPHIIFIHGPQTFELLTVVEYAKRNPDLHIFVDNHADYENSTQNWLAQYILYKILYKYCVKQIEPYTTKFYGVTPIRCDFLKDMYDISSDKIELLVMGADNERINFGQRNQIRKRLRNTHNISENDFVIVTGGKIDKKKNIHLLIQAVIELEKEGIKLIIIGTSDKDMEPIIDDLSKSKNIINAGWIESDEIYDYFLASDLAVFPGTHSVLWEQAIGTGLPCVFKYWKGMDHVQLGGNCIFLYQDEVSEIKKILIEIVDNPIVYDKMKKVSEENGIKKFSYGEISLKSIQY